MKASQWYSDINAIVINDERKHWLCGPNRLVEAFKANLGEVSIEALQEKRGKPFADESAVLQLIDKEAHIRQIVIATEAGQRLNYSRVVIRDDTYAAYAQQFSGLGRQFIGNSLLYNNKEVIRQPFEFACFDDSSLYAEAFFQLVESRAKSQLWLARRSIFLWQKRPLLITEFLLPYLATVPYTNKILTNGESHEL